MQRGAKIIIYAKDLSRKVKSAKRQRAYKGYYISAQAPYGYKVDPTNRNRLIVDEEAAEVVKEIFRLALFGHSLSQISRILSQKKIITPGVYTAQNVQKLKAVLDEYLNIEDLTANMLNQLIERIEIGHTVKVDGCRQQEITIVCRFIGTADEI